ncbi:hypothetical protein PM01_10940 [Sulfitobacter pontiacus 3SOLIMAR09]|nr:hypothetical protein PM01_10940 [Sulfitobacter pontiacus 3SOLIMAR09]
MLSVKQASHFQRLSFDPFPLLKNNVIPPGVDVSGCDAVQALMITLVIRAFDEAFDLSFEVTRQEVVSQQDAVLQ